MANTVVANLAAKLFPSLRDGVTVLRETLQKVQREIEELRRQRDAISAAPASRDDLRAVMVRWVESREKAGLAGIAQGLQPLTRSAAALQNAQTARDFSFTAAITGSDPRYGKGLQPAELDQLLCVLDSTHITSLLMAAIDALPDEAAAGLPWSEREGAMHKLDGRLGELLTQERELLEQAEEIGLVVNRPTR